ncbi:hypothetical protein Rctr85_002 [Virus Rctr85]|nr:hypothetical protein Rctr85_002 [Virus Rctr85]
MPIILYQIGDVPIFHTLVGADGKAVSIDLGRSWRFPTSELHGVGGSVSYLPLTRSLPETPTFKVSGTLHAVPPYSITRSVNALKSLGGRRNIPLIGFSLENPMLDEGDCISNLLWLYADTTIVDVDDKSEYNSLSNVWSFDQHPINLTIKAGLRWRVLSPWFWEYRDPLEYIINPLDPANAQTGIDNYFHHPESFDDLLSCAYFYRWQSDLSTYSTLFWGRKYSDGLLGGSGSDFVDFGDYSFYSDPQLWSADPTSVYAFTGLSPSGSISITVQRSTGLFSNQGVEEVSTLDLAELDTDLAAAGYSELRLTDIVYTGALAPFPGFVMRDGQRITSFKPKWSYPGSYPGETGRGYNTFTVSSEDTTGQVAFLHDYGVL